VPRPHVGLKVVERGIVFPLAQEDLLSSFCALFAPSTHSSRICPQRVAFSRGSVVLFLPLFFGFFVFMRPHPIVFEPVFPLIARYVFAPPPWVEPASVPHPSLRLVFKPFSNRRPPVAFACVSDAVELPPPRHLPKRRFCTMPPPLGLSSPLNASSPPRSVPIASPPGAIPNANGTRKLR